MSTTAVQIPGYIAGTWAIDPVHSEVSFVVRHMMVSKVRGRFDTFEGTIVTAEDPLASSVTASVDLSSINTGQEQRDAHIRSADFFEVEKHTHMTLASTGIRAGFSATTEINRHDFGVSFNGPIPGVPGGVAVSDKVTINLEAEGVLQA